jgi:hypothetical protein
VVADLAYLNETAVRRKPARDEAELREDIAVSVVELVAVTVPLSHVISAVGVVCSGAGGEVTWVCAQSHRAALVFDVLLL